jgi:putative membrane protein
MKQLIATLPLCLLLAGPAAAQSVGEKTGVNSVIGIAPSTADFVTQAAVSDMFEIQSSQLALERSDAATKTFAQEMVTDHQKTASELKSLVQSHKVPVTLPTALDRPHQSMLDKLKGLHGKDFTRQYHSDQVSAHEDAVSLFQRYSGSKEGDASLKTWAGTTLPELQHHLQMANELSSS